MLHVISYDIVDDNRRRRVFETLKDIGQRMQDSVFEVNLTAEEAVNLAVKILKQIDPKEDSCRIYRLCGNCESEVQILGTGDRYIEPGYWII